MLKFLILIIFLIIIFYLFNKFLLKDVEEHYLTYFLPYYDNKGTDLAKFYKNNESNENYFKKK